MNPSIVPLVLHRENDTIESALVEKETLDGCIFVKLR